jgi:SAM-dependent methyltransferase
VTGDVDDWDGHWADFADSTSRNPAQEFRRQLILQLLLTDGTAPRRLLDIGSGQGDLLASLREQMPDAELLGVELSAEGVRRSAAKVPTARFVQADLLARFEPPFELREWADAAVCSEVLEHVDEPAALLRHATAMLAPGARLVVTVPGGPRTAFDRHIGHRRHFTPPKLRDVLLGAGLEVERVGGRGFPFFDLYKLVVLARGDKVAVDVAAGSPPSRLADRTMQVFGHLLRPDRTSARWGWQVVGVARRPRR